MKKPGDRVKIFIVFLFTFIGISGCQSISINSPSEYEDEKIADEILSKVAKRLKQEYGLRPFGTSGRMLYDVEVLGLSFEYYESLDIAEGRRLLTHAVDELMGEINQDQRIHKYLCAYPFRPRNIEISIFLKTPEGQEVADGKILILKAQDGNFRYKINNPSTGRLSTVYQETYEQALERLADNSVPPMPEAKEKQQSKEELSKVRKGISYVDRNGVIWHIDANGRWVADPRSRPKK